MRYRRSSACALAAISVIAATLALAACGGGSSYNSASTATSAPSTAAASAADTPSITISPSRGPCDGIVTVTLSRFSPNATVRLDIATPRGDGVEAALDAATIDSSGGFSGDRALGAGGCSAAKSDAAVPPGSATLTIYVAFQPETLAVAARATYTYTSTEASTVASGPSTLTLTSDAFANNETIPVTYSCNGGGTSPALAWSGAPAGTETFALIVHDPDAPLPGGFTHWIVMDLPASASSLPAAVPAGDTIAGGGTQLTAYRGMCPPVGAPPHHYYFRLYALGSPVDLNPDPTKDSVEAAMQGHILAQTNLVGLFSR